MWKDLTIGQKSEVMRLAVQQGFSDLNNIKEMYDAATSVYNTSSNNTYDNVPYNPSPKDVRYAYGGPLGNIYKGKGNKSQQIYVSSPSIRKRISNWEGESMYKPAPDTGKVNNPFEKEDAAFWSTIPTNIRPYLTQDMLDALYSTSYNIGSGNFKKRVVPELKKFFIDGTGSIEAIKNSMYGTRDKEAGMSGLRARRAAERQMFEDAFNTKYPKGFTLDRIPYKTTKANSNIKWDGKKSIQENLESLGVKFIPTSGYRSPKQQSKFKTPASKSWHTHLDEYGNSRAIDIVPAKGMTFDDLRTQLMSPEVQAAFATYGLGVLDETSAAMKKKTGATGNHFHIGPDKSAVANYAKWLALAPTINQDSSVYYHPIQDMAWTPSVYSTPPTESIAPAIMETPSRPMIVDALTEDTTPTINFDKMWASVFPQVEEQTVNVINPYEQFTTLQSRPRYQMKSTPIINMPISNGDNDYMLFRPLT